MFRATVPRDGSVRLVPWSPTMVSGGPLLAMLRARAPRGLVVADLHVVREEPTEEDVEPVVREVVARFLLGDGEHGRDALARWAASVGYERLWFPDDVVDLEPVAPLAARTRCTGCRTQLVDDAPEFWGFVRQAGSFPTMCTLCGCDLPQWTVDAPVPAGPPWRRATGARTPTHVQVSDPHDDERPS